MIIEDEIADAANQTRFPYDQDIHNTFASHLHF